MHQIAKHICDIEVDPTDCIHVHNATYVHSLLLLQHFRRHLFPVLTDQKRCHEKTSSFDNALGKIPPHEQDNDATEGGSNTAGGHHGPGKLQQRCCLGIPIQWQPTGGPRFVGRPRRARVG